MPIAVGDSLFIGDTQGRLYRLQRSTGKVLWQLQGLGPLDASPALAGDLLYIIDPRPFEIALASAQAQLENAAAQRQLGQAQLARAGSLRKNDFVAASTYDERLAELRSAEAAVETANAAIRSAQAAIVVTKAGSAIAAETASRD